MIQLFAFDRNIFNPHAGKMNWGNHSGWCFELKLFGFTLLIAKGAR